MQNIVHVGAGGEKGSDKGNKYFYFEPRADMSLEVASKQENVTIFPFALSDYNGTAILNLTKKLTCSSFYEPNLTLINEYQPKNGNRFVVTEKIEIEVKRMDSLFEKNFKIHRLTIDTQGSELQILKGAGDLLFNTSTIVCEVEFVELYKSQPLFKDVTKYLDSYGFKFSHFARVVKWKDTLIFGDAIYNREQ